MNRLLIVIALLVAGCTPPFETKTEEIRRVCGDMVALYLTTVDNAPADREASLIRSCLRSRAMKYIGGD